MDDNPTSDDDKIRWIGLRHDEYMGPFWDGEWDVEPDFDDLQLRLGISRQLFDDIMAWNDSDGDWYECVRLLERLRAEVPAHIEVPAARPHPPRRVYFLLLHADQDEAGRRLVEVRLDGVPTDPLPPTPQELIDEFVTWRADHDRLDAIPEAIIDADPEEFHRVQDRGWELGRRVAAAWGPDFVSDAFPPEGHEYRAGF